MKKIIYLIAVLTVFSTAGIARSKTFTRQSPDSTRHAKPPMPHVVKGRKARMRLQLQQIKKHEKEWKKIDSVQNELDKETRKTN
jgi:hypothetical protein